MSDAICVCGHGVSGHTRMHGKDRGCAALIDIPGGQVECQCCRCRECLPWPDAPGAWWCSDEDAAIVKAEVFSVRGSGDKEFCLWHDGHMWHREEFVEEYESARFTKLLEPNPFGATR